MNKKYLKNKIKTAHTETHVHKCCKKHVVIFKLQMFFINSYGLLGWMVFNSGESVARHSDVTLKLFPHCLLVDSAF